MRDFLTLLRVQLLALANSLAPNAQGAPRAARMRRIALAAVLAFLLATVFAVYAALAAIGLAEAGLADAIPALAVLIGSLAGVAFTFMKARGTLFGARDHDLVMALPIPRRTVVLARMAALFGSAIVIALLLMVPPYVVFFAYAGPAPATVAFAVLSVPLAPLAPTALATFAAFGVTALATRFRRANLAYAALGMLLMMGVIAASYSFSFSAGVDEQATLAATASMAAALRDMVETAWPPAAWASSAVVDGSVTGFALLALAELGVTAVCVEIMQRCYLGLNGALAGRARKAGGASALRRSGRVRTPFAALMRREHLTLLGIPSYAFNCLFGYLMMLVIAVALSAIGLSDLVTGGRFDELGLDARTMGPLLDRISLIIPWVFAFCASTCMSAAVSVSLEGRSAWITATAPLSSRMVLGAKLASNAVPVAAVLAVSCAIMLVAGELSPVGAIETLAVGFGVFYLWANVGLGIDARRPNYAWTSPNEVVKRSAPITVGIIGALVCVFGGGALTFGFLPDAVGMGATHAVMVALGIAGAVAGQLVFESSVRAARLGAE